MKKFNMLEFRQYFRHVAWLRGLLAFTLVVLCMLAACKDDAISPDVPVVVAGDATDIGTDGATFHGRVVNVGTGFDQMGFVWDESASPDYSSSRIVVPVEKGISHFSARISADHRAGYEYTVKAYLKTGAKITFSNAVKFWSKGSLPPVITDFNPKSGLRNTEVTIHGKNFSNVPSHIQVLFGEFPVAVTASTDSTITVKSPQNLNTSGIVKITVSVLGKSTISNDGFEFGGIFIDSFAPKTTSCSGKVTIKGKNFTLGSNTYVYFQLISNTTWDQKYGDILRLTATEIDVKVPSLYLGQEYKVQIASGGYEAVAEESFVMQGPEIISISPLHVLPNDTIIITGNTMNEVYGVAINDVQMEVIDRSDSQVNAIIPEISTGEYFIKVSNNCMHITTFPTKITVNSQWKKYDNIPISSRIDAVSLTLGDKLYVGLGNDMCTTPTDYLNDWWEFNTISEKWTRKADFPGEARNYQMVTVHENRIVMLGGENEEGKPLNDFWQYNPATDEWKELSPYPPGPRYQGVIYSIQDKIYTGLGKENWYSPYNEFYVFDPSTNLWEQSDFFNLGMDHRDTPLYFTQGNGYFFQTLWGKLYEFDPYYGWSYLATISNNIQYTLSDQDDIIFIDGSGNVELIDFSNWGTKAVLPSLWQNGNRSNYFGAIANNRLYIGLGTGPNGCYNDMIYLDLNDYK